MRLEAVPNTFLEDVLLVEGEWIDQHVVELAEWGATMEEQGFKLRCAKDDHLLAWDEFVPADGHDGDIAHIRDLEARVPAQVRKRLARFRGQTREIEGRAYLHFGNYCRWRGRKLKGNLKTSIETGFVAASWNIWVKGHGGERVAELASIKIGTLGCYIDDYPFHVCRNVAEAGYKLRERHRILERLSSWTLNNPHNDDGFWERETLKHSKPFTQRVGEWKTRAEKLGTLVGEVERIVEVFHETLASDLEQHRRLWAKVRPKDAVTLQHTSISIDCQALERDAWRQGEQEAAYLVDLAKAEALDYLGDYRAAVEMVERHLTVIG